MWNAKQGMLDVYLLPEQNFSTLKFHKCELRMFWWDFSVSVLNIL